MQAERRDRKVRCLSGSEFFPIGANARSGTFRISSGAPGSPQRRISDRSPDSEVENLPVTLR
jgi:hypothetical protein